MWKFSGCLMNCQRWVNDAGMEEDGFIFSSSPCRPDWNRACHCLQVLLMWSFTVNPPFKALASRDTLLLASGSCAHCAICTHTNTHTYAQSAVGLNSEQTFSALLISIFISLMFAGLLSLRFHAFLFFSYFGPFSSSQPRSAVKVTPARGTWC